MSEVKLASKSAC